MKVGGRGDLCTLLVATQIGAATGENTREVPEKPKTELPHDPVSIFR